MVALFLRPDADQSDGSWLNEAASATNLFNSVDEPTTPSDTDYIVSSTTDGDKVRLRLSDPSGGVAAPLIVRYRCKRTGTQAANLIGRLYQGTAPGTLITTFTQLSVPDSFTTFTYTLTSGEFASITDFTDLYVEFELSQQSSLKVDLNLAAGVYYDSGTVADATGTLSCSRASTGYAKNADGTLTSFSSNVLRIGVGTGLLLEDARTNLSINSQAFNNANWGTNALTSITDNSTSAPDGTTTAAKLIPDTSGNTHNIFNATSLSGTAVASSATVTCFFKAAGYNFGYINVQAGANKATVVIDTVGGSVTNTTTSGANISITTTSVEVFSNGWARARITCAFSGGATLTFITVGASNSGTPSYSGAEPSFAGDGTSGVYIWGTQIEDGALFTSSYIPTTTAAATRAADNVSSIGNLDTILLSNAASVVVDFKKTGFDASGDNQFQKIICDATTNNEALIMTDQSAGGGPNVAALISVDGTANTQTASTPGNMYNGVKGGVSWGGAGQSVVIAGGTVATTTFDGSNSMADPRIGKGNNTLISFGYFRRLTTWNTKIADAALQGYTAP